MTLTALLADLYRRTGYQTAPATEVTTRLTAFLNETQREIAMKPGFQSLQRATITFASVAGQPEYQLPPVIRDVLAIRDTANRRTLDRRSESWYRSYYSDPATDTGLPFAYALLGLRSGTARPSNASELFVKSSDAADTTQTLHAEVVLSNGHTRTIAVTLNGTTGVSFGATLTTIVEVSDVYLSAAAAGTVTFHEDSGAGTQLGQINIGNTREQRWIAALIPTPSDAVTYTVDAHRRITDLVQGTDEPQLPYDFHPILVSGARAKEYEFRDDTRYGTAMAEYLQHVNLLRAFLAGSESIIPGGRHVELSTLGAWFPPDLAVR